MKSKALFKRLCRLCKASSDWCANENEWRDSVGNFVRSSVNCSMGDVVPIWDKARVDKGPTVMEEDLGGRAYGVVGEAGAVGARDGAREAGCCRILRRPDIPRPCSCSGMIGDLAVLVSKATRNCPSWAGLVAAARRSPVLLFFGMSRGAIRVFERCSFASLETTCRNGWVSTILT